MQTQLFDWDVEPSCTTWFQEITDVLGIEANTAWPDRFGQVLRAWTQPAIKPVRTLSLFSGGGGLDIAFHDAGFQIVEMIEINPKYVETLQHNACIGGLLEGSAVRCIDIRDYDPNVELGIDFIIGGPPCQTFSAAGRRASGVSGVNDPRGLLFEEYIRILSKLQPKGFLFENVYGIVGAQDGQAWQQIQDAFAKAGYTLFHRILDAADYGVPQHRERLFIVGVQTGTFLFPSPTHGPDADGKHSFYTAAEAINGINVSDAVEGIGGRFGKLLNDIPPGLNYSFYTSEMGHPSPVFSWRSKFSDFLYKADPDKPVRTLKAQVGAYSGPFHWHNRPFTVAELKRLQTFPDAYTLCGNKALCIEQVGNSVPPQLGRMLALAILDQVLGIPPSFPMRYLPQDKELGFRQRKRALTSYYQTKAKEAIAALQQQQALSQELDKFIAADKETAPLRYINTDFKWTKHASPDAVPIRLCRWLDADTIHLHCRLEEGAAEAQKYHVLITPVSSTSWPLKQQRLMLFAMHWEGLLFTALWKGLEEMLREDYSIADLVQLSGYYQYQPRFKASMVFEDASPPPLYWKILSSVVNGVGVASTVSIEEFAMMWDVEANEVLPTLKQMRSIGYEVRSHSTNPQITPGCYLIPYAFPTLTPRSIQLRKTFS